MADHKLEIKIGNVGGTPVVFLVDSKDPTKPVSEVSVKYEDKLILTCKQDFFSGYGKTNPFDPGQPNDHPDKWMQFSSRRNPSSNAYDLPLKLKKKGSASDDTEIPFQATVTVMLARRPQSARAIPYNIHVLATLVFNDRLSP
jgi:hypothetical protein